MMPNDISIAELTIIPAILSVHERTVNRTSLIRVVNSNTPSQIDMANPAFREVKLPGTPRDT